MTACQARKRTRPLLSVVPPLEPQALSPYNTRAAPPSAAPEPREQIVEHLAPGARLPVALDAQWPHAGWRFPGAEAPARLVRLWIDALPAPSRPRPRLCDRAEGCVKAQGHNGGCRHASSQPPRRVARTPEGLAKGDLT